jgi:ribosomal protein L12E/L44/L45/RPP1/RPP2
VRRPPAARAIATPLRSPGQDGVDEEEDDEDEDEDEDDDEDEDEDEGA